MGVFLLTFVVAGLSVCFGNRALPENLRNQIHRNEDNMKLIMDRVLNGDMKGVAYDRLANLTDVIGPRPTGSQALEESIDTLGQLMTAEGLDVSYENITAPFWKRNSESAQMILPREKDIYIMSLGSSVNGSIEADVFVVNSFEELEANAAQAVGKIVVYNQVWVDYSTSVRYRTTGATKAAEAGAVASLIRSITQYSVYSPHTGQQNYGDNVDKIPTACIAVEDATMMRRLQDRGIRIRVKLEINAQNLGNVTSRNLVAEIQGSEKPDEVVIIGGHIDSWDVGQGAMDDGGGSIISWTALSVIHKLGLRPKRTVRAVLWTAEEIGLVGSDQYFDRHKKNAAKLTLNQAGAGFHEDEAKVSLVMESDSGTFRPLGIGFTGSGLARAIMEEILSYLHAINTTTVGPDGSAPDTGGWKDIGVPVGNFMNANEDYFIFHHTEGDTMDVEDPHILDLGTVLWAVTTFAVADLDDILPREGVYPTAVSSATRLVTCGGHSNGQYITLAICLIVAIFQRKL